MHPTYGQPSVLAYKILQAVFIKMTEDQYPYPNKVTFTQRELARLIGRSSWGGNDGKQIYDAVMQLHRTNIQCSLLDKDTKDFVEANFYLLPEAMFAGKSSGKSRTITTCVIQVHDRVVSSLNKHHV